MGGGPAIHTVDRGEARADDRAIESSPVPAADPPPTLPSWLGTILTTSIGVGATLAYLVLFGWGLALAFKGHGSKTWPVNNADVQTLLSTIGGLGATIFAVVTNLPRSTSLRARAARGVSLWPNRALGYGLADIVLVVVGGALAVLYVPMTIVGFYATLARTGQTPDFIAKFSGPGIGVLGTVVVLWLGRLAKPR